MMFLYSFHIFLPVAIIIVVVMQPSNVVHLYADVVDFTTKCDISSLRQLIYSAHSETHDTDTQFKFCELNN